MRIIVAAVAVAMLLCSLAGGALAKSVPLYPTKIDLHFADAKGKVHTLPITLDVEKAYVKECVDPGEVFARGVASTRKPELYAMAYLGATCRGAKPPKAGGAKQFVDERPAMVVLFFIDSAGQFHYSSFGRKNAGEYQMDSCPLVIKQTEKTLLKQAKADHTGQEYRGASCFLRSVNLNNFR